MMEKFRSCSAVTLVVVLLLLVMMLFEGVETSSTSKDSMMIGDYIYPKPTGDFYPPSFSIKDDTNVKQVCFYFTKLEKDTSSSGVLTGLNITFHSGSSYLYGSASYSKFIIEYMGQNDDLLYSKTTGEGTKECIVFGKLEKIKLWRTLIVPSKNFYQLIGSTVEIKSRIGDINSITSQNLLDPRFKTTLNGKSSQIGIDYFRPDGVYLVGFQGYVVERNYIASFAPIFKNTEPQIGKKYFYGEFVGDPEKPTMSIMDENRPITRICCSKYKDSIRKNSVVGLYFSSVSRDLTSTSLQFNTKCIDYSENEPISWSAQTYSYTDRVGLFVGSLKISTQITQKTLTCQAPGFSESFGRVISSVDDSGVLLGVYKSNDGDDLTSIGPIWKKKIKAYILLSYDLDLNTVLSSESTQKSVASQTLINKSSIDQTMSIEGEYETVHSTSIETGESKNSMEGQDFVTGVNSGGSYYSKAGLGYGGLYVDAGIKGSLETSTDGTSRSSDSTKEAWVNGGTNSTTVVFKYNFPIIVGPNRQVTARVIYSESVESLKWTGKASIVYEDNTFDLVDLEGSLTSVTKSNVLAQIDQDYSLAATSNDFVVKNVIDSSNSMPELSRLQSSSGVYYLTLTEEGSLIMFQATTSGNIELWKSNQNPEFFVNKTGASRPYSFQVRASDGALAVMYGTSYTLWAINTGRKKATYYYSILDNGNLIQTDYGKYNVYWSLQDNNLFDNKTLPSCTTMKQGQILFHQERGRDFLLELQTNGVLVLKRDGTSVWESGNTPSIGTYNILFTKEGSLKIVNTKSSATVKELKPASGTYYTGPFTLNLSYNSLVMMEKGKVIYTLWSEASGEQIFTAKDSEQTFKVPDNVRSISVLCVGGGQAGKEGIGGGGGALSYCNDIPVTAGQVITLRAGVGEKISGTQNSDTYVSNYCKVTKNTLRGQGGLVTTSNACPGISRGQPGLNTKGFEGGGAAGYSSQSNPSNGYLGGGGGGVGIYGESNSAWPFKATSMIQGGGGSGGEGGKAGVKDGAIYGGGGGVGGNGGDGLVRIIWGEGRNFPLSAQKLFG